jgi:glyoxylase-like metal-dependent hydrolase (beta-lactamase superfamily II)
VLKGALGGLVGLSLAPIAGAAATRSKPGASTEKPATIRLNDKLSVITGVGGNVVALTTDDGLLLVDSGAPEHSRALMTQLRALPGGGRVRTLFNTHWHLDNTGSNEVYGKAGAKIVAHEKTKLWLATDHWVPAEERYEKARPKQAVPTETFYTTGKTSAGAEQIEYGYLLEAHTCGDLYVHFRDSNVLVVGDAVSAERDPVLDWFGGGWIGGRIDAQELLLKICNDQTRIVAGTGPVIAVPSCRPSTTCWFASTNAWSSRCARASPRKTWWKPARWTAWAAPGPTRGNSCTTPTRASGPITTRCRTTWCRRAR